jgi:hypothetical protein
VDEADERASCIFGSCVCIREYRVSATRLGYVQLRRRRLFLAISLINAIVFAESFGCLASTFDLRFQNKRKSSRCHPAQGLRLYNEERLPPGTNHPRAARNKRNRTDFLHAGRLTCRRRMMSCWRRSAFSATRSDFSLARSASVPSSKEVFSGLVQRKKPSWRM